MELNQYQTETNTNSPLKTLYPNPLCNTTLSLNLEPGSVFMLTMFMASPKQGRIEWLDGWNLL